MAFAMSGNYLASSLLRRAAAVGDVVHVWEIASMQQFPWAHVVNFATSSPATRRDFHQRGVRAYVSPKPPIGCTPPYKYNDGDLVLPCSVPDRGQSFTVTRAVVWAVHLGGSFCTIARGCLDLRAPRPRQQIRRGQRASGGAHQATLSVRRPMHVGIFRYRVVTACCCRLQPGQGSTPAQWRRRPLLRYPRCSRPGAESAIATLQPPLTADASCIPLGTGLA